MKKTALIPVLAFPLALAFVSPARGGEEPAWPCFHGPERDNKSPETGLLRAWPEGGPPRLWTVSGLGHGYSSVSVASGRVFTAGMTDRVTWVVALDGKGGELWRRPNGESWQASKRQRWAVPYAGSRSTPTVDGDAVYHLSELGRLTSFEAATGKERWSVDLRERFAADRPKYGYSESLLVHDGRLICCPGGGKGMVAALDKHSGRTVWANKAFVDPIGYASPVRAEIEGLEQFVLLTASRVFAVASDDGRLLWRRPFGNQRNNNVCDPVVHEGRVFVSTGYGKGCALFRPRRGEDGDFTVETVWTTTLMDNHHGGVVLHDGFLYGSGHEAKGWFCLDFETGKERWRSPGKGSLTWADGRLYRLDEKGALTLLTATPETYAVTGAFETPKGGRGPHWAHPVVCGGRLYVRHSGRLTAYDVTRK